jgi:hypothetical protein
MPAFFFAVIPGAMAELDCFVAWLLAMPEGPQARGPQRT